MALGVPEFRRALIRIGDAMDGDIGKLVAAVGRLDVPAAMRLVTDAYPELASPYLALAADLTATWYEEQPAAAGAEPFEAKPAELPAVEQLAANARWALTQSNPTTALQRSGQRQFFQQHRDTVLLNVEREGVGWAREARPGACGVCRVMATRVLTMGFGGAPGLYRSELTAGANPHAKDAEGHDGCRCVGVPIRGGEPYTVPGYVHDWLDDYEAVSRDKSGRLLSLWQIAAAMEQRGAMRGEPIEADASDSAPVIVDLDAGTPPSSPTPAAPREPLALPAGQSAGQLAIEAPKRQLALNRKPAPLAIEGPRQLLALTAAPDRPAVTPPDPRAIADWLDAEDDHRHAVEYWRRVDEENLHSLPAEQAFLENPPAETPPAALVEPAVELATPDPEPVVDVQVDDHAGETALDRAVREFEEALASGDDARIEAAADAMERAERAEQADAERKAKAAARREAARNAEQDRIFELVESGEDPQLAEAEVLASNADGRRRAAKLVAEGHHTQEQADREVYNYLLQRIRRRDFMAQARADGHRGKGFDDLVDSVFQRRVDEMYLEAEAATNGHMVGSRYMNTFSPKRLWYVNEATARKYMSEEMANWFDENGRLTRPVFRQMILDGETNLSKYTHQVGDFNA